MRPYSSLPRGQDINNYPSLATYQANIKAVNKSPPNRRHSPAHRSHSEDVYTEREECETTTAESVPPPKAIANNSGKQPTGRINPLTKAAAEGKLNPAVPFEMSTHTFEPPNVNKPEPTESKSNKTSPRRKLQYTKVEHGDSANDEQLPSANIAIEKRNEEKRVSFEENSPRKDKEPHDSPEAKLKTKPKDKSILKPLSKSLDETRKEKKMTVHATHSLPEEQIASMSTTKEDGNSSEVRYAREEDVPTEQCDIEPLSGTVFRKVTVRRRRQDMRKVPAIDNGELTRQSRSVFQILEENCMYKIELSECDDFIDFPGALFRENFMKCWRLLRPD